MIILIGSISIIGLFQAEIAKVQAKIETFGAQKVFFQAIIVNFQAKMVKTHDPISIKNC